jgi:hypothetical protein
MVLMIGAVIVIGVLGRIAYLSSRSRPAGDGRHPCQHGGGR